MFAWIWTTVCSFVASLVRRVPPPPPAPRYPSPTSFGLEVGFAYYDAPPTLADLKPQFVRQDVNRYTVDAPLADDHFVSTMTAARIPILFLTPYNYQRELQTPDAMAATMAKVAKKFAGKVWAYEIINEPNAPAGSNGGARSYTPEEYMAFLRPIAAAIRASDPAAKIVSGGTSGVAIDYHLRLANLGMSALVDYIGFHPYGETASSVATAIARLATVWMLKPLICTEYGDKDPATAVAVHRAMDGIVYASNFFCWKDADGYGLVRADGLARPSFGAMRALFQR